LAILFLRQSVAKLIKKTTPYSSPYNPEKNIRSESVIADNVAAMSSAEASKLFVSVYARSKSFMFCFIFLFSEQNPKDFADTLNIHLLWNKNQTPHYL
tara:strand:- start:617 stop:910 length:294 start_codon:yes stop_codon:yes gene_type:complete